MLIVLGEQQAHKMLGICGKIISNNSTYSSSDVNRYCNIFQDKITESSKCTGNIPKLTIYDIVLAVHKQKSGKAAGPDGIHGSVHLWWSAA